MVVFTGRGLAQVAVVWSSFKSCFKRRSAFMAIVALVLACLLTWWVEMGGLPVSRCFFGLLAVMVRTRFVKRFIEHR